jgi:hypothetical protein
MEDNPSWGKDVLMSLEKLGTKLGEWDKKGVGEGEGERVRESPFLGLVERERGIPLGLGL